MPKLIEFTVPGVPVAQPRARAVGFGGRARMYNPTTADAFKASTMHAFTEVYDGGPMEGPISLCATFVMPRTKNQIWKKKPMERMAHTKRPDIDNLLKSLMDALSGLAWRDDTQVCALLSSKYIAGGHEQPHVEVLIREMNGCPSA